MSEYIELAKKCGAIERNFSFPSGAYIRLEVSPDELTAYSEALRAKDKEEIERLKNVLFQEKEHRTAQRLGYKTELAATQHVLEQMRELFDAILNPNDHLNVWSIYSPRMSDEAIYKSIAHYALALQVSTDALQEHDVEVLRETAQKILSLQCEALDDSDVHYNGGVVDSYHVVIGQAELRATKKEN